jgi:hypothetical protein
VSAAKSFAETQGSTFAGLGAIANAGFASGTSAGALEAKAAEDEMKNRMAQATGQDAEDLSENLNTIIDQIRTALGQIIDSEQNMVGAATAAAAERARIATVV